MHDMRYQNVTFAGTTLELIKALYEPHQWPGLRGHVAGLLTFTTDKIGWDISYEEPSSNIGATEIAKSVILGDRLQSYVAHGAPDWLRSFFESEKT
ncbi:unnamed protein product [Microthlaspi erraticum]|uniref:Uncharacterized protein n=1 Tax=Microthlaspi erraticum TaxID=1685480 RepID=A0A6D2K1S0_9BRAS|nr:unnamed protein product [Microthlaspi erraticum]